MAGLTPLPQTVTHSSTRLTHRQAYDFLSIFLERSQTDPAYRPDAYLSTQGPQAANAGDGSNLTLRNLDLILKGIEGRRIGGIEWNSGDGRRKRQKTEGEFQSSPPEVVDVEGADGGDEPAITGEETGDWQDKEDFEHAQADVTADLEGRDPAGEGVERFEEPMELSSAKLSAVEREQRKLAKQQRRKAERRATAQQPKKTKKKQEQHDSD